MSINLNGCNRVKKRELSLIVSVALRVGGAAVMLSTSSIVLSQSNFSAVIELSDLDGTDGFMLKGIDAYDGCLLYTSPSPRDQRGSRMPSSA